MQTSSGLRKHYGGGGCEYQNLSIQIIKQVAEGDIKALEQKNQLRSYIQNGDNAKAGERKNNDNYRKWGEGTSQISSSKLKRNSAVLPSHILIFYGPFHN